MTRDSQTESDPQTRDVTWDTRTEQDTPVPDVQAGAAEHGALQARKTQAGLEVMLGALTSFVLGLTKWQTGYRDPASADTSGTVLG